MELTEVNYKWRDRFVLVTSWGILIFSSANLWASESKGSRLLEVVFSYTEGEKQPFISPELLIFILALLLPLILACAQTVLRKVSLTSSIRLGFHSFVTISLLLTTFAVTQIIHLILNIRNNPFLEFIQIALITLIALWLMFRRAKINLGLLILITTWSVALTVNRLILNLLIARINFVAASWYTKIFILVQMTIFSTLSIIPLLLTRGTVREKITRVLRSARRFQLWVFVGSASVFCFIYSLLIQFTHGGSILVELAKLQSSFLATLLIGFALYKIYKDKVLEGTDTLHKIQKRWFLFFIAFFALGYALLATRISLNNIENINPDSLVYMIISRNYAEGNPVVRGYWAPLLSWILAPLISIGIDPQISLRVIGGVSGTFWILLADLQSQRVGLGRISRLAIAVAAGLIVLSNAFGTATPDFLGAIFLGIYFYWITHPGLERKPFLIGIICGLSGALAYYSKYYNLPFLVAHLSLTGVLMWVHKRKKSALTTAIGTSFCVLVIIVLPWILAINARYDHFTFSTSGPIVNASVGPGSEGHVCWIKQLCDQPSDVLIPWEDPQPQYYAAFGWSPFDNLENMRFQILRMKENIRNWFNNTMSPIGPTPLIAVLAFGVASLFRWENLNDRFFYGWNFLTVLLYVSGYILTSPEGFRYFLPVIPIMLIALFKFIEIIYAKSRFQFKHTNRYVLVVFMIPLVLSLILQLESIKVVPQLLAVQHDSCLRDGSIAIRKHLAEPIAGTDRTINFIAYYSRMKTYGAVFSTSPAPDTHNQLRDLKVKTFIAQSQTDLASSLIDDFRYEIVSQERICDHQYTILRVPDR